MLNSATIWFMTWIKISRTDQYSLSCQDDVCTQYIIHYSQWEKEETTPSRHIMQHIQLVFIK